MKGLAVDCAVSKITIAAKNDDKTVTCIFDIGMRQSEILIPSIDEVLKKVDLSPANLDYTALTVGPGSFTGLRLVISALKAIELAYNVPVFGISSLKAYSYPFSEFDIPVISCIDANKDKFYASITSNSNVVLEDGDWEIERIISTVSDYNKILICGPDSLKLSEIISSSNKEIILLTPKTPQVTTDALFTIAEDMLNKNEPSLKDFDGPVYLRASEAEIKLNSN